MNTKKALLVCLLALSAGLAGADVPATAARELGSAVADAVERVMPAVVVVRTEATVLHPARDLFFGEIYQIPERLAGQGSGVIIDTEGHVLTSHHVIQGAQDIEVVLHDGTKYPAKRVGRDPLTDLAVLKIQAPAGTVFSPIEAGDSDRVRVGEFAIAIGSPFSLDSSVTLGIVSQKGRRVGLVPYEDFIQTDASINPGNSGGPLVDIDGRMIGINAVIQTGSPYARGNIGIGFAVPVNLAMRVADSLIRTGTAERPWVGMQLRDAEAVPGAAAPQGVVIGEVFGNTPAERVGVKAGDVILRVDGQPATETRAVQRIIFGHRVGDTVKLDVRRGGKDMVFEIVTERMPDPDAVER